MGKPGLSGGMGLGSARGGGHPNLVFFAPLWWDLTDWVSGASASIVRDGELVYLGKDDVYATAPADTAAIGKYGVFTDGAGTQYFVNPDSPVTQTIDLGTGGFCLWVSGSGSAAVAANTATIDAGGTATDGSEVTFAVTGAGTVDVTITDPLDWCQLESGTFPSSRIYNDGTPGDGSTVSRATQAADSSGNGIRFARSNLSQKANDVLNGDSVGTIVRCERDKDGNQKAFYRYGTDTLLSDDSNVYLGYGEQEPKWMGGVRIYDQELSATEIQREVGAEWTVEFDGAYGVIWDKDSDTYQQGHIDENGLFIESEVTEFSMQKAIMRCLLLDDGSVNYFLDPNDSTKKTDGTAATLDGTDGQVMTQYSAFYKVRQHYGNKRYFFVSPSPFKIKLPDDSKVFAVKHPAFTKSGSPVNYRYIGAYEGYNDGGILCSIAGVLPTTSQNRGTFRSQAEARGSGWHQFDEILHDVAAMMYITEYADFDTQSKIGRGIVDYASWPGGPQALTGNSNTIGNATSGESWSVSSWAAETSKALGDEVIPTSTNGYTYQCTVAGTTGASEPTWPTTIGDTVTDGGVTWECVRSAQYMSFRGLENWYGHIWKFMDGANVHNSSAQGSRLYLCNDPAKYDDDTDVDYTMAGLLPENDGYVGDLLDADGFFLADVTDSGSIRLCDYYYTYFDNDPDIGWRVVLLGASATYGSAAGAFCVYSRYGSASSAASMGGRLCF